MNYNKKSVEDIDVNGKKVLVRCDFNVPLDGDVITDPKRIVEALPTIKYLLAHNAKVILCSHLGRPKGEFNMKYSLAPVAAKLSELLGKNVTLAKDVIGEDAKAKAAALKEGEVLLLENVRFHKEEEKNDPDFAKELASMAEIYVNDAFGTAHRAHASTEGVSHYLPAVCGYLIEKEIRIMGGALSDPKRPFVAILGGAKVSDKIGVITNLLEKADTIIVGGAGTKEAIADRVAQIKNQYEVSTSDYDREKLMERLARLSGGVAVIKVGAATEAEMKEKKLRVEDALNATKAAVEEGIVAGGGTAYVQAGIAAEKVVTELEGDEKTGAAIVAKALQAPLMQIAANAGLEGAVILNQVRGSEIPGYGFDAAKEEYCDMIAAGIVDPTKVCRSALENAASVASTVLTTEAMVVSIPEPPAPAPAAPDMGGMY